MRESLSKKSIPHRVVVTGVGVVAPNGTGITEFKDSLEKGRSGIRYLEPLQHLGLKCQVGGIPDLDVQSKKGLPPTLKMKIDASSLYFGLLSGLEAWDDAGLSINEEVDWDSGVVMGMQMSDGLFVKSIIDKIYSGNLRQLSGRTAEQAITSALSTYLAGYLGLGNCANSNSSACATGTESVVLAFERIQSGKAQRMLAGSSEGSSPLIWAALDHIGVLNNSSNEKPQEASRPLSKEAGGIIPGCGAAALVLENLEAALHRKAKIYCEVLGGATNCGGQRNGGTMTKPNPAGIKRCIQMAVGGFRPTSEQVGLISGHLTGTFADPLEVQVWSEALHLNRQSFPYINSIKSMTGHCLAAAGSMECVAAVLQLQGRYIYPTINSHELHPDIIPYVSPEKIPNSLIHQEVDYVLKGSFGFGDLNSCCLFKKYTYEQ